MVYVQQRLLPLDDCSVTISNPYRSLSSRPSHVQIAIDHLANAKAKERGAIFTRREVVEFILDLVGYVPEANLSLTSLLEPSFGYGDFLLVALERLLKSYFLHGGRISEIVLNLSQCLQAVELHKETFFFTYNKVLEMLRQYGISTNDANELTGVWLKCDDFLLTPLSHRFTYIIGNPPYLRQELIPDHLITYYRSLYKTVYSRADLYIPFIERCLALLASGGKLSFICSNRWITNTYGGPLREFIANKFHLQAYIDMVDTEAFRSEVIAYPAIFLLTTQKNRETYVVHKPAIETPCLEKLATSLKIGPTPDDRHIQVLMDVANGDRPWIIGSTDKLALLQRLEENFPLLEEEECKVSIGVATGCDSVYIGRMDELPIEEDRRLPLVMVSDIQHGRIIWNERYIVNPFDETGKLVDLSRYPLLAQYFKFHEAKIRNRNVAKRNSTAWYRTIDKIYAPLIQQPKLLIPDIKGEPTVVYDQGKYYPHHNLYYVTSTKWDLCVLQAILQSPIAKLFVSAYSVKMRGGYLRFQAQNIRRIRLPRWEEISLSLRERLITTIRAQDKTTCDEAVFELYRLSREERLVLQQ